MLKKTKADLKYFACEKKRHAEMEESAKLKALIDRQSSALDAFRVREKNVLAQVKSAEDQLSALRSALDTCQEQIRLKEADAHNAAVRYETMKSQCDQVSFFFFSIIKVAEGGI